MDDLISRQAAIDIVYRQRFGLQKLSFDIIMEKLSELPSAEPEEVIPHRNYEYLSDYWCACGWHLGKKGDVKYCAECGKKVNWGG